MSLGDSDAKFPGQQGLAIPPSPSRENPGQVYPKSDPTSTPLNTAPGTGAPNEKSPERFLGNPYLQKDVFGKVAQSLREAIQTIEREQSKMGGSPEGVVLVEKLEGWSKELRVIMAGGHASARSDVPPANGVSAEEGGMFRD